MGGCSLWVMMCSSERVQDYYNRENGNRTSPMLLFFIDLVGSPGRPQGAPPPPGPRSRPYCSGGEKGRHIIGRYGFSLAAVVAKKDDGKR